MGDCSHYCYPTLNFQVSIILKLRHLKSNKIENSCLIICVQTCCTPFGLNQFSITVSALQEFLPLLGTRLATPRRFSSVQFSSVAQSCPTLCDPMNRSTPGLPVHHQFPEFTQTHVHRVSDAIQPSHPLSSPSPPAPNPSQHQSLFQMSQLFA